MYAKNNEKRCDPLPSITVKKKSPKCLSDSPASPHEQ